MAKITPEERKRRHGEREWQRRQDEADFYRCFGGGPIVAFTRPGSFPAATAPAEQKPQPAKPRPASKP